MHRAIELTDLNEVSPNYEIRVKEEKYFNTWRRRIRSQFNEESGLDPLQTVIVYKKDGNLWKKIESDVTRETSDGYFQKNVINWESAFAANEQQTFRLVFVKKKEPIPCLLTGAYCAKEIQISLDKVFVGYAFAPQYFRKTKFRNHVKVILRNHGLDALLWEERTERGHFDCKICEDIQESLFTLFEFSDSNPNVAFEFGLAIGIGKDYFILWKRNSKPLPSDIRDLDHVEYGSYRELRTELVRRMEERYFAILGL